MAKLEFIRLSEDGSYSSILAESFFRSLTLSDPSEALLFASEGIGANKEFYFNLVFDSLPEKDITLSLQILEERVFSGDYSKLVQKIAIQKLVNFEDPSVVLDWAVNLPNSISADAQAAALLQLVDSNPTLASSKLDILSSDIRQRESVRMVRRWASQNPHDCAKWLSDYTKKYNEVKPVEEFVKSRVATEPLEVYEWLGTLEKGAPRDSGIMLMVLNEVRFGEANDNLVEWVNLIGNDKLKSRALSFYKQSISN